MNDCGVRNVNDMSTAEIVDAALRVQEDERLNGFASANPYLEQLRGLPEKELLDAARGLRTGARSERELSARILGQSSLRPAVVVEQVRRALSAEDDPVVVRWLVSALQHSRSTEALPVLMNLSTSRDPAVRFVVPDALSSCAERVDDIADILARLMRDPSRDVRWSATFEACAWIAEERSSGAARILVDAVSGMVATEPDSGIRALAVACSPVPSPDPPPASG